MRERSAAAIRRPLLQFVERMLAKPREACDNRQEFEGEFANA
jgi:hypothetical protein